MNTAQSMDALFERISENGIIKSIRQGLLYIMPLIMVGSFVLMILNLPIEALNNLLYTLFGEHWRTVGLAIHKGTFRIMSLSAIIAISYAVCKDRDTVRYGNLNPIAVILTSLSCYITFDPATEFVIDETATGPTGMFGAIVIAIVSANLFLLFYSRIPRKRKVYAYDADSILMASLYNVLPTLLTIASFALFRLASDLVGAGRLLDSMSVGLNNLFVKSGGGIITTLIFNLTTHIMWFFGIHGTNVLEGVAGELFVTASDLNIELVASGLAPTQIITKEFFDNFVYLGGAGCTLGLLFALLIAGKNSNAAGLARYSFLPGIFGINEQLVYGLPIIFNPYYLVPFMVTPTALSIVSYLAFSIGLVPLTTSRVVWTTPIFISGYVATGSWAGVILQLVNLSLAVLIYLPFVRLYENRISQNNLNVFKRLSKAYNEAQPDSPAALLDDKDELGLLARTLLSEISAALDGVGQCPLRLEYQPKVNTYGRVVGAEALLRWSHHTYGNVSPLVVLGLCDEADLTNKLGAWVFETAFAEQARWRREGLQDLTLSVNLSPKQLKEDEKLPDRVANLMRKYKLDPAHMEIELTEHAAIDQSLTTRRRLAQIRDLGVSFSIDDFGMGNSSLLYLRDFYANVVKIDISLVRSINTNLQSQEIVRSIVSLCRQLDVAIVAEGVETQEQLDKLTELGCAQFQGWYYSRALPSENFMEFVEKLGGSGEA